MSEKELCVSGTLVWYYYICPREVWLISHQINADQDNDNVSLGRFIGENTYLREKKEVSIGGNKIDVFHMDDGEMVIGEIKKSSKFKESARMQLAFYLSELKKRGINARGELRFPKEKVREEVILDDQTELELDKVRREILSIIYLDKPPQPHKIKYCKNCAYAEFCWS